MGGGGEEMPRATGGVEDPEAEEGRLGIGLRRCLLEHRVERGVEEGRDKRCRGVVAPRRLALITSDGRKREGRCFSVDLRVQLEKRLVDGLSLIHI